jgi:hypothetical protein
MRAQKRSETIFISAKAVDGLHEPWSTHAQVWVRRTATGERPPNTVEYVRRDVVDKAIRIAKRGAREA